MDWGLILLLLILLISKSPDRILLLVIYFMLGDFRFPKKILEYKAEAGIEPSSGSEPEE